MDLLIAPRFSANELEFTSVDERVASLQLQVGGQVLTVVCVYVPNSSSEYPLLLEYLEKVLESAPTGDSIVLLGHFNAHVGNDSENWRGVIGRTGLLDLNQSCVHLRDFFASHSLSLAYTRFGQNCS